MRNKQRQAITDWIAQNKGELAITLTFLPDITEARARKTLRRWWNEVDRIFYGNAVKSTCPPVNSSRCFRVLFQIMEERPLLSPTVLKYSTKSAFRLNLGMISCSEYCNSVCRFALIVSASSSVSLLVALILLLVPLYRYRFKKSYCLCPLR